MNETAYNKTMIQIKKIIKQEKFVNFVYEGGAKLTIKQQQQQQHQEEK
jgi:hypothetical protein